MFRGIDLEFLVIIALLTSRCRPQSQCPFASGGFKTDHGSRTINVDVNGVTRIRCIDPGALRCPTATGSPYRSADGSCYNVDHPEWGMAFRPYGRLLDANYGDGISMPTRAVSGNELPSARHVSVTLHMEFNRPDEELTIANMQFGQFVSHDLSMLAGSTVSIRRTTQCCTAEEKLPAQSKHPLCYPIAVSADDPLFTKQRIECLNFVRTIKQLDAQCPVSNCSSGFQAAEPLSAVTAWLDLSHVYGNSAEECSSVRSFRHGRIALERRNGCEWPMPSHHSQDSCDMSDLDGETVSRCYRGGDTRINQNTGLTVLQISYMREHNRLADGLRVINPMWSDERLFQEARRINVAAYQHVIYYEWLPIMLGRERMLDHGMIYHADSRDTEGYASDYDASVDPASLNEHSTAAFRYFHTQIEGHMQLLDEDRHNSSVEAISISDWNYRPGVLEVNNNFDGLVRCMTTQSQQKTDAFMDAEIHGLMFKFMSETGRTGLDLRAMDIQRGRDHGLASYNAYREWGGLPRATQWNDYLDRLPKPILNKLQGLYESFEDVDLNVAGGLEKHAANSTAGPTYLIILLEQFLRLRKADRYFFENGHDRRTRFTRAQLDELRKSNTARVLCDNSVNVKNMQSNPFRKISVKNKLISCQLLPSIDLKAWKDPTGGYDSIAAGDLMRDSGVEAELDGELDDFDDL